MLKTSVLVVRDGHPLERYLIMLDERVHATQGGLEGREPVGRLFRNIEEYLYNVCYSLPLCWKPPSRQRADHMLGVEPTHIDLDSNYFRNLSDVASETWLSSGCVGVCDWKGGRRR